ncbi:MAG: sulfatase-like hydrolase/transferase, partial [Planctomycetaceae bacterium]|nr:sulfatase-like hydrolase/transferase [Planctomycetaceae bacterium]
DFASLPAPPPEQPVFVPDLREYDNAPLRAGKGSTYEGGIRVPMIARWPRHIPAGSVVETPVHAVDLLPTCFDVAHATAPEDHQLDGRSLLELMISGSDPTLAERPIFQFYPFYELRWGLTPNASIRVGDYKLIEFFGDRVDAGNRYVVGPRVELYNLRDDIGEAHNLAEADRDRTAAMQSRLHAWLNGQEVELPRANEHFDPLRAFEETREKPDWLKAR